MESVTCHQAYLVTIDADDETALDAGPMVIEQRSLAHVAHLPDTLDHSLPRYRCVYNPRTRCQKVSIIDAQSIKNMRTKEIRKRNMQPGNSNEIIFLMIIDNQFYFLYNIHMDTYN